MKGKIADMLLKYSALGRISFSMPGHKQRGINPWGTYDVTELPDTDSLHHPSGAVEKAENRIAQIFSCDRSLIMVNGSTGGIFAMLAAACRRGEKVLVSRISHISVINACVALGLEPIFFEHILYEKYSIYGDADLEDIKKKLEENDVSAILVTSPNYYGIVSDIKSIRSMAKDIPLLVDEAHGAHFFAGDFLPQSAVRYCDMAVQSAHKTLDGLNQSAFLHINGGDALQERARAVSCFFQTSSPSYIIAASAESAAESVAKDPSGWENTYRACVELKNRLRKNTELLIPDRSDGFFDIDETRPVFNFSRYDITGHGAGDFLREECGIDIEMSDTENIVLIATPSNSVHDFEALGAALEKLCKNLKKSSAGAKRYIVPPLEKTEIMPSEAFYSASEYIPFRCAEGKISAAVVTVYPPGVPLCVPGSRITQECVKYLENCGGEIVGMKDGMAKVLKGEF